MLFFADLEYCSLLLLSFVGKFFAFHENYSLFVKKVIRQCFENKSDYSWLCFKIILGRLRKLFVAASRVSETILRGSRKLFFGHMKIYVFVFCFKVPVYLVCRVLPCVVLWIDPKNNFFMSCHVCCVVCCLITMQQGTMLNDVKK